MDLPQPTEQGAYFFKRAFMGILSPDEIERQSVVEITETTLYEDHLPKKNGLLDPRMGPLDRHVDCETCGQSVFDCVGHPGHIRLCKPVFQPYTLPYVHKTLRCFCFACSSMLISTSRAEALGEDCKLPSQKLSRVSDWCSKKAKRCPACGFEQPTISRQQYILFVQWKGLIKTDGTPSDEKKFILWPEKVMAILKNVADDNLKYLGLPSRPENMIISILCVSPVTNRPPVHNESAKGSDMLTKKMTDILLHNEKLRRYGLNGAWKPSDVHQYFQRLQYHVTTLMNSTALGSGKPVNNLRQPQVLNTYSNRVNSKEGWVRGNSMGKRVDNSARAVITPDSNIAIDEVGLPKKMAMKLIFPEPVTPLNRLQLIEMVNRGPNAYPGATILQRKNGDKIDLKYRKPDRELRLELGDVVHRHILTGDRVLVNRQPSLHRMSMMSHKAVILPGDTIRLNPSVTTPYNADFDGDEMNIHVETTYDAVAEGQLIMDVPNNILSPTTNRPIIGFVMDHLLGVCLMSTPDIFFTKADFMLYLSNIRDFTEKMQGADWMPVPAILKPEPLWTGKQLLSLLIPKNVRLDRLIKNAAERETEEQTTMSNTLLIQDGNIISGYFKKNTISGGGSLIHKVVKKRGPYVCSTMIYDMQRATNRFMQDHGFSFGPEDCAPSAEARRGIKRKLAECYEKCEEHTQVYQEEKTRLERDIKSKIMRDSLLKTLHATYEDSINKQCTMARDSAGTIAATALPPRSEIKMMVSGTGLGEFGSKGSYINISQLAACVGPVNISGKLPQKFFKDRCLPCFPKNSDHPDARGMVSHSFHDTLGPAEYFFHAMGGREGLMDTAVKVSYTGYLQRRLTKACESVEVLYDGTVRDAQNNIIQFVYGEDGLDCTLAEFQDIARYTNATDQEFDDEYRWNTADVLLEQEYQKCSEARRFFMEYRIMLGSDSDKFTTFVNVTDLLGEYRVHCRTRKSQRISEKDAPIYVDRLEKIIKSLLPTRCNRPGDYRNDDGKLAFVSHVRLCLSSKRLSKFGIPLNDACKLLDDIEGLFMKAVINPGEMAGVVAAEAIGEPSTQMTLNTFHLSGVGNRNVSLGVPRLKELTSASESIATPLEILVTPLPADITDPSSDDARRYMETAANKVTCQSLSSVCYDSELVNDVDPFNNSVVIEDIEELKYHGETMRDLWDVSQYGDYAHYFPLQYSIRCIINQAAIDICELSLMDVAIAIENFVIDKECLPKNNVVTCAPVIETLPKRDASGNIITPGKPASVRVIVLSSNKKKNPVKDLDVMQKLKKKILGKCVVKGIPGVEKAYPYEQKGLFKIDPDTGRLVQFKRWVIESEGNKMAAIRCHPKLKTTHIESNHPILILKTFGIDAARHSQINQLRFVLTCDGSYVNYRHITVLADFMTHRGHIMPLNRFGINRMGTGYLQRCTFEQTMEEFTEAAVFGETDEIKGPSECIMVGRPAKLGTGLCDLVPVAHDRSSLIRRPAKRSSVLVPPSNEQAAPVLDTNSLQALLAKLGDLINHRQSSDDSPQMQLADEAMPWLSLVPKTN